MAENVQGILFIFRWLINKPLSWIYEAMGTSICHKSSDICQSEALAPDWCVSKAYMV